MATKDSFQLSWRAASISRNNGEIRRYSNLNISGSTGSINMKFGMHSDDHSLSLLWKFYDDRMNRSRDMALVVLAIAGDGWRLHISSSTDPIELKIDTKANLYHWTLFWKFHRNRPCSFQDHSFQDLGRAWISRNSSISWELHGVSLWNFPDLLKMTRKVQKPNLVKIGWVVLEILTSGMPMDDLQSLQGLQELDWRVGIIWNIIFYIYILLYHLYKLKEFRF